MKIYVKIGLAFAFLWILIKLSCFTFNVLLTKLEPFVFMNMLFVTIAISVALYIKKRKQKELKAKQSKVVVKEIRFGPNTDDHDFNFKLAHAKKFLSEGSKVKAFVFFRGRTIVFKDRGEILLLRFAQELADYGVIEQLPKMEGKKMNLMINPKKK